MSVPTPITEVPVISPAMVDAIKVQFLKPIREGDFPEKGMKAWLVDVVWSDRDRNYRIHFDFAEFEGENEKYFKETHAVFFDSRLKRDFPRRDFFTAKEVDIYSPKYSVYFSVDTEGETDIRDDELLSKQILSYLRVVQ